MKRRTFSHALATGLLATLAAPRAFAAGEATLARIVKKIAPLAGATSPAEKDMKAYLLTYFKDETHSIHFASSTDGYTFTDINGGAPVLLGKDLAEQKGVRDPHLMRGPDNAFYLAMTDLHIFAQREGLRSTEWERPGEDYGWGNNRSMIFMKSYDLINWTYALVRIPDLFPEFSDIGAAWAPQTIFDSERKKLMIYFTVRHKSGPDYMAYAYADDAFTTLESTPRRLFTYPDKDKSTIDGDITKFGGKYHLYYVAHDKPGGLRHAVSDQINQGYKYDPRKVDPETVACEAPMLWRRIGSDSFILMYDVFGAKPNNMGFSETTDFVSYKNLGRFNEAGSPMKATNFSGPKHGSVTHITAEELTRLQTHFKSGRA
jgi:hypothetical protein